MWHTPTATLAAVIHRVEKFEEEKHTLLQREEEVTETIYNEAINTMQP